MTQTKHDKTPGKAFIDALIHTGYSPQEAAEIQIRTTRLNETAEIGAWNMHARPDEITEMWERAALSGATRLVLDISVAGTVTDDGEPRVHITVLDRDGPTNDASTSPTPITPKELPMTNDDLRRKTAEIASHLAEIQALARTIQREHPDGQRLYRELNHACLPAEHADPVGTVEDILQHPLTQNRDWEEGYERFR